MWQIVIDTLRHEFSDLSDTGQWVRLLLRLGLAVLLGALIGYEREQRESAAGLRTHMLVALGSALFVLVPQQAGMSNDEMSRVLQGLVAGVGFLGAGAVIKQSGQVHGLTTAAGIWSTAAIGVAVGLGREATAIVSAVTVVIILGLVLRIEKRMGAKPAKEPAKESVKDPERPPGS